MIYHLGQKSQRSDARSSSYLKSKPAHANGWTITMATKNCYKNLYKFPKIMKSLPTSRSSQTTLYHQLLRKKRGSKGCVPFTDTHRNLDGRSRPPCTATPPLPNWACTASSSLRRRRTTIRACLLLTGRGKHLARGSVLFLPHHSLCLSLSPSPLLKEEKWKKQEEGD